MRQVTPAPRAGAVRRRFPYAAMTSRHNGRRSLDHRSMHDKNADPMNAQIPDEFVRCDHCGADDTVLLVTKGGFRVVRCRRCSLVYLNPRLRFEGLTALYTTESFVGHQLTRAVDESWRPEAEARVKLINDHHPGGGTLLDVGCSTGWFLGAAARAGWKVVGIDVSGTAVAHCRSQGLDARLATITENDLPAAGFDVITMFDSIEHMPSPAAALDAARKLLAPGGILVITTPNIGGFFPRFTYALFGRTLGAWEHPGPPGHVFQFSEQTLAAALNRARLSVVLSRTSAIPLDYTVGALEDVLMDALKGRSVRPASTTPVANVASAVPPPAPAAPAKNQGVRLMRRAVRGVVRLASWALVGAFSAPAPLFRAGDNLLVVARARS